MFKDENSMKRNREDKKLKDEIYNHEIKISNLQIAIFTISKNIFAVKA